MAYKAWREEFLSEFARTFPGASHSKALAFLRDATAEQRWNEISCSIDIGETETARQEKRSERRLARVRKLAESIGAQLSENGDPRGCPFGLVKDGCTVYVPGRGLPARCFQ